MNESEAFCVLTSIPYLGAIKIRKIVEMFGSALEALKAPAEELSNLQGFDRVIPYWNNWQKRMDWKEDLKLVEKFQIQLLPFTHTLFPKSLLELTDCPALLYLKGNIKPQDQNGIAVVGTRNASIYGNEMASNLSKDLACNGYTVISGLARGVDTSAHQGALIGGRTLAVIGSGLSQIYPPENRLLAESICAHGALISEFPMNTPPDRLNFPQRNRIVSGMSLGTILIEAPLKSGAMITMDRAYQQKRKLFALPGRADNDNFHGNHWLIKTGRAQLIENAQDVISHFQDFFPKNLHKNINKISLDSEEQSLFDLLPNEEISIDSLTAMTSLQIQHINRILMSLVLKKAIKEFPGKLYKKLPGKK